MISDQSLLLSTIVLNDSAMTYIIFTKPNGDIRGNQSLNNLCKTIIKSCINQALSLSVDTGSMTHQ